MQSLWRLNKYFAKYYIRLSLGICFVILSNLFAVYPAQVIRAAVDMVMETATVATLFNGFEIKHQLLSVFTRILFVCGMALIAMALIKGFFMFFMRQTLIVMSRLIEYDLKNDIYQHYQVLSASFFKLNQTGDLMNRISEDVSRARMYIGPAIMYSANLAATIVIVLWSMFNVSSTLSFYVLLPLPLMSIVIYVVSNRINKQGEVVQQKLSDISSFVQQAVSGIRLLKAYNREATYNQLFAGQSEAYRKESMKLATSNAVFYPILMFLIGLSTILTVYIGGNEVMEGKLTQGNIAEFVVYINMLTWPFASIGWVSSIVQRAAASQRRINEFLDTEPQIVSGSTHLEHFKGKLEFNKVSLVYPESGITALSKLSFTVEPGTSLGITGRTGSGKSSIAALATRTFDATQGEVLYDNVPIQQINLQQLRSHIGYVPQDVFLFSDTIACNIAFGLSTQAKDSDIEEAAKKAAVHHNIIEFSNGYQTRIGERGVMLSGGQKQRISIARALIRNPTLLILDDCISAVDAETEEEILRNIKSELHQRTTLLISHRVSALKDCDNILVLDNGEVVAQGTHQELLASNAYYAELAAAQLSGAEVNEA